MPSLYNETNKRKQLEMEGSENESDYSPLEENQNALEEEDIDNDNVVDDDYDIYSAPNEVVTETKNLEHYKYRNHHRLHYHYLCLLLAEHFGSPQVGNNHFRFGTFHFQLFPTYCFINTETA